MSIVSRTIIAGAIAGILAPPASAQRGGRPPAASRAQSDTTKRTPTPAAVALDFQEQELKVVLDAIAAAGQLNVSLSNIPQQRVTVHLGKPVPRDSMASLLKSVAESHGLKVTSTPTLMQIAGTPVDNTAAQRQQQAQQQALAQQLLQQNQAQQVRLFTMRLRHASAVQLAPVLSNLFSGFVGVGTNFGGRGANQTTIVPNPAGGFNVIGGQINTPNAPPGNIQTNPGGFNPNTGQPIGGRGGGRGAAAQAADALATVTQRLQQVTGALSSQASEIRIIAEESSNSLLVRATEADFQLVQQVVQGVDLRPLQVLVEVTIAQVQRTHDFDLGVSGTVNYGTNGKNATSGSAVVGSQAGPRD
ncbi:MAG TPA: secretin N-terminal domain-containing protein, partial [Gemmatimonadaceae bacterium]